MSKLIETAIKIAYENRANAMIAAKRASEGRLEKIKAWMKDPANKGKVTALESGLGGLAAGGLGYGLTKALGGSNGWAWANAGMAGGGAAGAIAGTKYRKEIGNLLKDLVKGKAEARAPINGTPERNVQPKGSEKTPTTPGRPSAINNKKEQEEDPYALRGIERMEAENRTRELAEEDAKREQEKSNQKAIASQAAENAAFNPEMAQLASQAAEKVNTLENGVRPNTVTPNAPKKKEPNASVIRNGYNSGNWLNGNVIQPFKENLNYLFGNAENRVNGTKDKSYAILERLAANGDSLANRIKEDIDNNSPISTMDRLYLKMLTRLY